MTSLKQCDFFLLRYVPDAVKEEFVNVGVVLLEENADNGGFADLRLIRDWRRVHGLAPEADLESLEAMLGGLRNEFGRGRYDRDLLWSKMQDLFSNALQISPLKACLTESPAEEMNTLAELYLEPGRHGERRREPVGRQLLVARMREAFEQAGVWALMRKQIAVAQYTHKGDPLKLDCGYRPNGVVRLFHAVSLQHDLDAAKVLAFSVPQIREGIARLEGAKTELTAIIEDELDRADDQIAFALATLEKSEIVVRPSSQLPQMAEQARVELRV